MYIPPIYEINDPVKIEAVIRELGFATLISSTDAFPLATHTPMELIEINGKQYLEGHIAKGNSQWKFFESHPKVLAVFLSPAHHYISSSWYEIDEVPTWNYISVQVSGTLSVIKDEEELWKLLQRLVKKYERDMENPLDLDALPEPVKRQVKGIVGFHIEIERVECAFKLSQGRSDRDMRNIVGELRKSGNPISILMADIMEQERNKTL